MESYKEDFIHFMIDSEVLKFGDFVTKSGRNTPFFVNTGFYRTGSQLHRLGQYYAAAIAKEFGTDFDVLFGPAYKGIPLSVATSIALSENFDKDVRYCSDRKEAKDHGEKGSFLGGPMGEGDKVLMIEDVTTAGTSIHETYPLIKSCGNPDIIGLIVSVDRQERGKDTDESALKAISKEFHMKTTSIVTMSEVIECLYNKPYDGRVIIDNDLMSKIDNYYQEYGAKS